MSKTQIQKPFDPILGLVLVNDTFENEQLLR
jgi:hypothetical protein